MRLQELFKQHVKNVVLMFAVLFLLVLFFTVIARAESHVYICKFCYEQNDSVTCEAILSKNLEESQELVMQRAQSLIVSNVNANSKFTELTIDCNYPNVTEMGYRGYNAVFTFKK